MSSVVKALDDLAAQLMGVVEWLDKPATLKPQTVADLLKGAAASLTTFSREIVKLNVNVAISNSRGPQEAAQPAAYGNKGTRLEFSRRPATKGTASQVSFGSRAKSVSIPMGGFADEDTDQSPSTPTQSVRTGGGVNTPSSSRPPASAVASSSVVMGGFADESDSDVPAPISPSPASVSPSYTVPEGLRPFIRLTVNLL
ncbi:hypothetical protein CH63R_14609 [Colletotrichum higginsianum IMI 349063]|uniref:Uncharacterized protein n=1 Tax=Colletotrichum higginsianum (strain IMI 349063) TaxID=759273 RepID=A0A1B7XQK1_COLHI|nr:hypothetical protein CH63R_14609 [Colletotrichum higginsianum IMI 349063]OBR02037.1 hypothetical protein CH63R_14609 [Colletotrichum higginsianum IMI 349063]